MVLTSAGNRRADLEVLNICVAQQADLMLDVTLRHEFIGAGRDGTSASYAPLTTQIRSLRTPLLSRFASIATPIAIIGCRHPALQSWREHAQSTFFSHCAAPQ